MKLLLIAATPNELKPLLEAIGGMDQPMYSHRQYLNNQYHLEVLLTGVGLMHTAYYLAPFLQAANYDWVINAGVAGSFETGMALGTVVNVVEERIGDQGAENNEAFLDLTELGLLEPDQAPYDQGILKNPMLRKLPVLESLPQVSGISVNKVHGHAPSIDRIRQKYNPVVESMEGAAIFYACLKVGQPFYEIRAISNWVTPRDRDSWNLQLAVKQLNDKLLAIINTPM